MNSSVLECKSEQRRFLVRQKKEGLNGLDYLEVSDDQLTLIVYFLGKAPETLEKENIQIKGGKRIKDIQVTGVEIHREEDPEVDDCAHITVNKYGDFSTYTLCLIDIDVETKKPIIDIDALGQKQFRIMRGFDPRYSCIEFSFKSCCASDLDCKSESTCLPTTSESPNINYLAKDYASFRQLILDRLAVTMPDWAERHIPDLGITLVELLAYVGDHLSYYQDAVATEAYLDTARKRVSVRRHVRLVDYQLHEGCNARAWVVFQVSNEVLNLKVSDFYLITDPGILSTNQLTDLLLTNATPRPYLVFKPLVESDDILFYQHHNKINFYTWGDEHCCLPLGATSATIVDPGIPTPPPSEPPDECDPCAEHHPVPKKYPLDSDYLLKLNPCDILIFEEVKGAKTGNTSDKDPNHRCAVRLTKVERSFDVLKNQLIWEIEWAVEDALPFSLCISSIYKEDCSLIDNVSVVRGNVLLVDHGQSVEDDLGQVPLQTVLSGCGDDCTPRETTKVAGNYQPYLPKTDITFSQPLLPCVLNTHDCCNLTRHTPATALLKQDVRLALPAVKLQEMKVEGGKLVIANDLSWTPRLDLLNSSSEDANFVVELEEDRRAQLRFGQHDCGKFPEADTHFKANYRIGNGSKGNVGAESITHIVFKESIISGVTPRNPMPAVGGTNPELISEAKLYAPDAFRKTLARAITADDYAQIVMRDFASQVQRAAAKLRWAGSWFEVLIAIDQIGTEEVDQALLCAIRQHLCQYHRIGHDVVVASAHYVPLEIALTICVKAHFLKGHVKAALLEVFSSKTCATGKQGFFHPDRLTFGGGVYLSQLVATAQAIEGVESVVVAKLQRQFEEENQEIENGILPLGPFEVAQVDNDPNYPEHGKFTLEMRGGR